jgi:hypothetical protein
LTVNGSGFVSGSVVRWNGGDRTTTFQRLADREEGNSQEEKGLRALGTTSN